MRLWVSANNQQDLGSGGDWEAGGGYLVRKSQILGKLHHYRGRKRGWKERQGDDRHREVNRVGKLMFWVIVAMAVVLQRMEQNKTLFLQWALRTFHRPFCWNMMDFSYTLLGIAQNKKSAYLDRILQNQASSNFNKVVLHSGRIGEEKQRCPAVTVPYQVHVQVGGVFLLFLAPNVAILGRGGYKSNTRKAAIQQFDRGMNKTLRVLFLVVLLAAVHVQSEYIARNLGERRDRGNEVSVNDEIDTNDDNIDGTDSHDGTSHIEGQDGTSHDNDNIHSENDPHPEDHPTGGAISLSTTTTTGRSSSRSSSQSGQNRSSRGSSRSNRN